ncbi:MAG: TRAP transporter small permease [Defluviicoccus sp.]|nr:TRAP transporter small permease [Defluviicoccus sp.]MDE0276143.1 TRAP transporter small permease [Defluviicoccus sp.]
MDAGDGRPGWLRLLDRWVERLTFLVGGIGLAVMVLLTSWNVIVMRKALNDPIVGAEDILILNLVILVAVAIPYGGRSGAHIEIEIFETWMSKIFARRSLVAMKLLAIPLVAILAWRLFKSGASARDFGEATQQLLISYEPFYYAMGAMIALYAAILIADLILLLAGRIPAPMPEPDGEAR